MNIPEMRRFRQLIQDNPGCRRQFLSMKSFDNQIIDQAIARGYIREVKWFTSDPKTNMVIEHMTMYFPKGQILIR